MDRNDSGTQQSEGRFYSKPTDRPYDVVAPQHEQIHATLERWARWNCERDHRPSGCNSVESLYNHGRDGTPAATAHTVDPMFVGIERALISMPEQYRVTLRLFYVYRCSPGYICAFLVLRKKGFAAWMFTARAMLINLLRRHGLG